MQVFIIGSPFETAKALDKRRLNRQIQEVKVILDALNGAKAWSNHPCVLQYRGHEDWLKLYKYILEAYRYPHPSAVYYDLLADKCRPPFHTQKYFDSMKRRLYTKDKEHYAQWAELGESEDNFYFVDGEWRIYRNGKRIK
jgi:hypothetical protein